MMVIGIDADVQRIAWSAWQSDRLCGVRTILRTNTKRRLDEVYHQKLTELMRFASEQGARLFLEGIYLAEYRGQTTKRNVDGYRRLAEVQGEIKHEARRLRVPLESVQPSEWQSAVLGFTRDREKLKAASLDMASSYIPDITSDHEADAICIGLFGLRYWQKKESA